MIALLLASTVAMGVTLVGTRYLIPFLQSHGIGQPIQVDGPEGHYVKAGTPTMGGITLVLGVTVGYAVSHIRSGAIFTRSGVTLMAAILAAAAVGLIDDYIKVSRERNLGLNKRAKMIGLFVVAAGFSIVAVSWAGARTTISFIRYDAAGLDVGQIGWIVWAIFVILSMANAVNLTDGLDGLAGGSGALGFTAFVVIGFWSFRNPSIYQVSNSLDLAIVAAAMAGGCVGFLWWNAPPARIFMGDTGSLAIGTGLAGLALLLNAHLLLPIIGGLYVLETISVVIQVISFRSTGRRIFRMAPIHHHFELGGWPETTVLIRLWIINGLLVTLGLGIYYADFIQVATDRGLL